MSREIDVNWSDEPSTQGLPPSYHHVDQSPAVKHSLHNLLPVLVGEVYVVNLQQPIVHSGKGDEGQLNENHVKKWKYKTPQREPTLAFHLRYFLCPPL